MAPSVFLASTDPVSFDRTVRSPIDLADHSDHPDELDGMESVRLWGAPEGSRNVNTFERMESGDLVLFYGDGEYVATGRVGTTFEDDWASEELWDDAAREHCYTVEAFSEVTVPARAVHVLFDYDADYTPGGLIRVADSRVDRSVEVIEGALARYSKKRE